MNLTEIIERLNAIVPELQSLHAQIPDEPAMGKLYVSTAWNSILMAVAYLDAQQKLEEETVVITDPKLLDLLRKYGNAPVSERYRVSKIEYDGWVRIQKSTEEAE
ncbi:MAG: hypothetical protein OXC80_06740 [Gammaproteobacteria bacterium]|nr:hypothetical protein [Gammaproteobacteria bacterium]